MNPIKAELHSVDLNTCHDGLIKVSNTYQDILAYKVYLLLIGLLDPSLCKTEGTRTRQLNPP